MKRLLAIFVALLIALAVVPTVDLSFEYIVMTCGLLGMAAATAAQQVKQADGNLGGAPIAASTALYKGTLAFWASGYLDDDTGSGANSFAGVVKLDYDNSSGSAGDLRGEVYRTGVFYWAGTGFAQTDIGKSVYATNNNDINLTNDANSVRIGQVVEFISATEIGVELDTHPEASEIVVEEVTFTEDGDTTYTGSVPLPAGVYLLDIEVHGVTLWDDGTSASLKVGDGSDDDGFYTGIDVKATDLLAGESLSFARSGGKEGTYIDQTGEHREGLYNASARTITGVVTTGGQDGTAGATRMLVKYIKPSLSVAATGA
ncbi:MAG: hypothetical protein QGF59_11630 [Pirellulaceae bacterium]|nr:hypothetical protein [Pirellulaceae bacterium]